MRYLAVGVTVLLLDQLVKQWITKGYALRESVEIVPKLLWFTRVHNYGAAFGLLSGRVPFLVVLSFLLIAAAVAYRRQILALGPLAAWGLTCILSGALSNLCDRLFRGYVVDFIDVRFWPVFNLADVAVVVGVLLVGWQYLAATPRRGEEYRG